MRMVLYHILGIVLGLMVFLNVFFIYGWWEHTEQVQTWISESVADFQQEDIDWDEFLYDDPRDLLLKELRETTVENSRVFRTGAIRDENIAYMDTIYDLIYVIVNTPDDNEAIKRGIVAAQAAQADFYIAVDRFVTSRLYAIRFTF